MYFDNYDAYYTYIHTHKIPGTRVEVNKIKAYSLKKIPGTRVEVNKIKAYSLKKNINTCTVYLQEI